MANRPARRFRLASVAGAAFATFLFLATGLVNEAFAQRKEQLDQVPVDELLKAGELPEITVGSNDAKITFVEYASMTCPHCAHFATTVFPEIKKKYIDTGKIRYIFREFPLDNLAAAASMLTRCGPADKTWPMVETMFATQNDWAFAKGNPVPKLFEIAKQAGFTQESFDKCLTDQKLLDQVNAVRARGNDVFGVSATPTIFIDGKRFKAAPEIAEFDKVLEPLIKEKGGDTASK